MSFNFKKRYPPALETDIHSHLLPGLDDGAACMDDTLVILEVMARAGVKKICFTPHIRQHKYPNTPQTVQSAFRSVQRAVAEAGINIQTDYAAEYYIDDGFQQLILSDAPLLTLPGNRLLVETSPDQAPPYLHEFLFTLIGKGYTPVLAHPERYIYCRGKPEKYMQLKKAGCLFQVNLFSFVGYYGYKVKEEADFLLKHNLIDFRGSDIHNLRQAEMLSDRSLLKAAAELRPCLKNEIPFTLNTQK